MNLYSNMLCSCVGYPFVMLIVGEFSFALSPRPPLISMLWRALFVHLRNLFCDKADAAQGIKEENNIEIGGRGEREGRFRKGKHSTTQSTNKLLSGFTCEIIAVTSRPGTVFPHN